MMKQIALLKTKPGMDRDAFIRRYEDGHVPLINELVPYFSDYRRNFIVPGSLIELEHIADPPPLPDFDVITQLWFADRSQAEAMLRKASEPDIGRRIAEDEKDLFDRSKMTMFNVDERVTPSDVLQPRPAGHEGKPAVKQIALLRRKPGLSHEEFVEYYENNHAPLAIDLLTKNGKCIFADYRRNFVSPGGKVNMDHVDGQLAGPEFDVISEFSYWTKEDFDDFIAMCGVSEIGAALAEDEAKFMDRENISIFLVEEYG